MKPIEPGCLCLSLDSVHHGECTADQFVPARTLYPAPDGVIWQTTADGWSVIFADKPYPAMVATNQLIRIDGGEPESVDTQEDMGVSA
ncbi:hypothetical protein [Salinicola halophyticus]|uniref:hypothetical protein n=1 Tax=Salinicola halophyticus TaxID=1808881 RepID=UPI003F46C5B1